MTSPCSAASANEPTAARFPAPSRHSASSGLSGCRVPIITSWPLDAKPSPRALPTSPLPRMPILMGARRQPAYLRVGSPGGAMILTPRRQPHRREGPPHSSPAAAGTRPGSGPRPPVAIPRFLRRHQGWNVASPTPVFGPRKLTSRTQGATSQTRSGCPRTSKSRPGRVHGTGQCVGATPSRVTLTDGHGKGVPGSVWRGPPRLGGIVSASR